MSKTLLVQEWWEERIKARTQIDETRYPEPFLMGVDFRGEGPWYPTITTHALYTDFIAWDPKLEEYYTKTSFMMVFKRLVPAAVFAYGNMRNEEGKDYRKKVVKFSHAPIHYHPSRQNKADDQVGAAVAPGSQRSLVNVASQDREGGEGAQRLRLVS